MKKKKKKLDNINLYLISFDPSKSFYVRKYILNRGCLKYNIEILNNIKNLISLYKYVRVDNTGLGEKKKKKKVEK